LDANIEGDGEVTLRDLTSTPLEELLAQANPTLRSVLLRYYSGDPLGSPSNGRFNSFIEPDL
jgi:hypothetical protein